jgi:hypothetical protein
MPVCRNVSCLVSDCMRRGDPMNAVVVSVRNAKTILLTTYRRDETAVGTPVSIAFDGDRAFFRYRTLHYELRPHPGEASS